MQNQKYDTEFIKCPFCNEIRNDLFIQAKDRLSLSTQLFTFVKCKSCGLIYQNPRVTPETINFFYPNNYYEGRPGRNKNLMTINLKREAKKRHFIETYNRIPGNLLEIGSANGDFLVEMKMHGWQVRGIEFSNDAAEYSQKEYGLSVFSGDLLSYHDDEVRFDIIVLWAVLSHIPNPVPTLTKAAGLLSSNGKLVVLTANPDSYVEEKLKDQWGHLDLPRHYCLWSPTTLSELYKAANLNVYDIIYSDNIYNSNMQLPILHRYINEDYRRFEGLKKLIVRTICKISQLLNASLTYPINMWARKVSRGGIFIMVGSKK